MINIIYDSFSLQANGITTSEVSGIYGAPPRDLQIENIAGADGGVLVDAKYRPRPIILEGHITGSDQQDTEEKIQLFKRAMNKEEKELKIDDEGDFTTYTASFSALEMQRNRGLTKANYRMQMMCAEPTGLVGGVVSLINTTSTQNSDLIALNVVGSYKAQPQVSITIDSFTGSGDQSVSFRNSKNFAGITITRTWTAGDEITIDSLNLDVTVNGSVVDFTGIFPEFEPGSGTALYSDTFSARSSDIVATYNKRKL